jgi:hypothetical protein
VIRSRAESQRPGAHQKASLAPGSGVASRARIAGCWSSGASVPADRQQGIAMTVLPQSRWVNERHLGPRRLRCPAASRGTVASRSVAQARRVDGALPEQEGATARPLLPVLRGSAIVRSQLRADVPLSPPEARRMGWMMPRTLSRRFLMSTFSAWIASFSRSTTWRSWYGCWLSRSRIRWLSRSIWFLVRSRMARWASRSFARLRESCSGVRLATPRGCGPARRFLFGWPSSLTSPSRETGVLPASGDAIC